MTDRARISSTPVGVSGITQMSGMLYHQWEHDQSWRGLKRDQTIMDMLNDPVIGSVLMGIEMLVRRVDWTMQAADESNEAQEIATFVEECLVDMDGHWPGDTLAQVLTFLGWGWSCMEITYKRREGQNGKPSSRHDDGRIGWRRWELRPQPTRYGWEFRQNEVVGLIQQDPATFQRYTIPLDKCLLFRYASRDNSPEGMTPLRIAFDAWFYKRQLQRIEAIGIERDLAGLPVGRVPSADISGNTDAYRAMVNIVTGIRNDTNAGVVLMSDRDGEGEYIQDLELLSSGGSRSFDTDTIIRRYANEVVMAFLANVMRAGQDSVGSLALSTTQNNLFQQAIGAHLDTIGDTITEQAIIPLVRLNGYDAELAPRLTHGDIENADLERLGGYIVHLAQSGMLADTPELRAFLHEVAGLPAPPEEDEMDEQDQESNEEAEDQPERETGTRTEPVSEEEIADAVAQFDRDFPEWAGLLDARPVKRRRPNG